MSQEDAQPKESLADQLEREIREDERLLEEIENRTEEPTSPKKHSLTRDSDKDQPAKKKQKKAKRESACKVWAFTWNSYTEADIVDFLALPFISHYCFQEEDEGTPHLQGVFRLKVKKRKNWLKTYIDSGCHFEHCISLRGSITYCSRKSKRRNRKRYWSKGWPVDFDPEDTEEEKLIDPLAGKDLYRYQEEIIDMIIGKPHDRHIHWYFSKMGCIGKSSIVKHLCMEHLAVCIGGKFADAQFAIAERVKAKRPVKILLFDIPRSQGNKVSYVALENIKNGNFFSTKYESRQCMFNPPHVIVFANEFPNKMCLSEDRWVIHCLDDEKDLQHLR